MRSNCKEPMNFRPPPTHPYTIPTNTSPLLAEHSIVTNARFLRVLRVRRVKWKIMLPFVVLTALFAIFATRNVTELVSNSLEERLTAQLVTASQRAADDLAKKEREHLELVRAVAFTEGLTEAVAAGDSRAIERLVLPQAVNTGAERIEVFDAAGRRLYGIEGITSGSPALLPLEAMPADYAAVSLALSGAADEQGDKWAAVVPGRQLLLTAGPLRDSQGRLIGAVAASSSLAPLLVAVKTNTLADVTIALEGGAIAASTFDTADAGGANNHLLGTAAANTSAGGSVLGRDFQFLRTDLLLRGEPAGSLAVALPQQPATSASQAARLRMSVIFGAIAAGAATIGWLIARNLTGPLGRLVRAATAVSEGDLSARSNVRTSDEIGVLGVSFDGMAARLERQHLATIGALASAIDARDPYTAGHSVRVGDLSAELGGAMGLPKPALHHLRVGGLLHDIGKIGVRDTVLLKPGALTPQERELIQCHPTIGLQILASAELPKEVLEIVGGHHERLNGTGYPAGLTADELSVFPRIASVADVYDALTTDRPYRAGMTMEEALALLMREAASGLMDPEVVATMRRISNIWEERRRTEGVASKAWLESLNALGQAA